MKTLAQTNVTAANANSENADKISEHGTKASHSPIEHPLMTNEMVAKTNPARFQNSVCRSTTEQFVLIYNLFFLN